MNRRGVLLIVGSVMLASCATGVPVSGRMQRSNETFSGSISGSGYSGGTGQLVLVSSRKSECKGSFTYTTRRRGEGVLNCSDGRTGPFHIAAVDSTGSGYGDLDGQRFTFNFDAH